MTCLFCTLKKNKSAYVCENASWYAIPDKFPASPGHALVILKNHKESIFELDGGEWMALQEALTETKKKLDATQVPMPDAYNVGVNDGKAAGRMIDHVHVHLIPRYASAPGKGGIEALLKGGKA